MSFYSANKNFIHIKLHSEMKGISDKEKLGKYENIKVETRKRLKEAYVVSNNLFEFYEETFEHLLYFEQEFLIINLFFEQNCNRIFNYIKFGKLSELKLNKKFLFSYKFINYMNNCSSEDEVTDFLKVELTELLSLKPGDWDSLTMHRNSIVKKYAIWLITSNKTKVNIKLNNYSYLLLCKIWNHFENYTEHFDEKSIVFYNTINEKFNKLINKGVYVNLNQIVFEIKTFMKGSLFKDLNYYPIIDNKTKSNSGYNIQRNRLNENIKLSNFLCKSYKKESYGNIFKMMIGKDDVYCDMFKKEVNDKLDQLILPNKQDLDAIIKSNFEGKQEQIKKEFLRRLYIY
ncbi:hypothetical protein [Polaribacter aquimarinus]|uniref:Uncharacterized protein n=1 Tax=Polaribacter aquimarinus TaxID=2100726 RepID=A0A2U2JA66_9FLAO|nr:hypothetical protein [Polaribacter aquimarinus]PWG05214.1 hypothetical protein DIS07_08180 [Polaribacter aquimarinus]